MPIPVRAYGTTAATEPLKHMEITRRDVGADDVKFDVLFCGICHSDILFSRSLWMPIPYPAVPGHEIIGRVTEVGSNVTNHKVGDIVGVGCLIGSCLDCHSCSDHQERDCKSRNLTYGGTEPVLKEQSHGGYSEMLVVDKHFCLKVNPNVDLAAVAPLLCAGITTWSPLKRHNVTTGTKLGVVGLGGLGHMAVKLGKALGADVTVFTTSAHKVNDATRLGATNVVISSDSEDMKSAMNTLDIIIDTVSAQHQFEPYVDCLKMHGTYVLVGVPDKPINTPVLNLIRKRANMTGSGIGGIKETQELIDFCAEHNISADIELIELDQVNESWDRVDKSDVKYRFVIDMQKSYKNGNFKLCC